MITSTSSTRASLLAASAGADALAAAGLAPAHKALNNPIFIRVPLAGAALL
jgi:hypothetical protein